MVRNRIAENLAGIREMLPNTRIIWSDILPGLYYYGEMNPGAGRRSAHNFNAEGHRVVRRLGNGCVISHGGLFSAATSNLFRIDGLHLSAEGIAAFHSNLAAP